MPDCLQSYGPLQHARLPCPSRFPGACSNSCPLNRWCCLTIFSVIPLSLCPWSFPSPGSFPVSQFLESSGQSTEASASASVLPVNIQGWFPLGLTWFDLLTVQGFSRVFSSTTVSKHQFFSAHLSLLSNFTHPYVTTGKTIALTIGTFVGKVIASAF